MIKDYFKVKKKDIEELINIVVALAAEKNANHLLESILTYARSITGADAGTLYIKTEEALVFKIMQNDTMGIYRGGKGEAIDLPPVPLTLGNVSSYVALTGEIINIADVYECEQFDFSGPKKYDALTGYRTCSMLVVPMVNHEDEIIGVMQLINAKNREGDIIPFNPFYEKVVASLASLAAVTLTRIRFIEDIENLLVSFVRVMAAAVDALTPYNATQSRRVAEMAEAFARYLNEVELEGYGKGYFDDEKIKQLVMAAWLHDIGKIAVSLPVMNKPSRLGEHYDLVMQRLDYIRAKTEAGFYLREIAALQAGKKEEEEELKKEREASINAVEKARETIRKANDPATVVDEELADEIRKIASMTYEAPDGSIKNWLTDLEKEELTVPRGTLTAGERQIIESHVEMTEKLLKKIPFPRRLEKIPHIAATHHECLNGKGYPRGLKGDEIPLEGRILALLDIFEALTAEDRPYKKSMPPGQAVKTLGFMVEEGRLDAELYEHFCRSRIWEKL